jgi:hypothetical protein
LVTKHGYRFVNVHVAERAMAEDSGKTAGETPAKSSSGALPEIESPPLSPAEEDAADAKSARTPTELIVFKPQETPRRPNLIFKPSHRRNALMAATVLIATGLGTFAGLLTGLGLTDHKKPAIDLAAQERAKLENTIAAHEAERAKLQHTIATLDQNLALAAKDIAALKTNLTTAKTSLQGEVAKLSERIDSAAPEITGSIPAPPLQTVSAPMPPARPVIAAHRPLVRSWFIRFVRDGEIFVQSRGDIYLVQQGAPLPGLGPVQEVRRQDGRWYVVTPKGLIVARRDRTFFEQF